MYLDLDKMQTEFIPGVVLPLRPFRGRLGVAPVEPGQYSTVPPGRFAGNLDIGDRVAGTSLYVPVFVKGALLWSGDSHAGQGNGEINLTAIETAYKELNITVEVLKGTKLEWPRIETPTHWITIGYDQKLNVGWDLLKSETSKFLAESRKVSKEEADKIMVRQWDCRISEVVNVVKGTYCMNPKSPRNGPTLPSAENAQYYVTVTKDSDLDKAMDGASMAMINLLQEKRQLTRLDAYGLASIAMDCRIAPPAAGDEKSVHCLLPKSVFVARRRPPSQSARRAHEVCTAHRARQHHCDVSRIVGRIGADHARRCDDQRSRQPRTGCSRRPRAGRDHHPTGSRPGGFRTAAFGSRKAQGGLGRHPRRARLRPLARQAIVDARRRRDQPRRRRLRRRIHRHSAARGEGIERRSRYSGWARPWPCQSALLARSSQCRDNHRRHCRGGHPCRA